MKAKITFTTELPAASLHPVVEALVSRMLQQNFREVADVAIEEAEPEGQESK